MAQHGETRICTFEAELKIDASQNVKGEKNKTLYGNFLSMGF